MSTEQKTSQLREKASEVGQSLKQMGQEAGSAAKEKLEQFRETASEYYGQGREKAVEWKESLESYIQEQPVKSILIASGIGLLIGLLWKRSR